MLVYAHVPCLLGDALGHRVRGPSPAGRRDGAHAARGPRGRGLPPRSRSGPRGLRLRPADASTALTDGAVQALVQAVRALELRAVRLICACRRPESRPGRRARRRAIDADAIADGVVERDRSGAAPYAEMARGHHESGLLGITVPHADGGPALGPSTLAEVVRVIAAVDPAIAQTPQAHYLFVDAMALLGTASQKRRLLGDVLAGARQRARRARHQRRAGRSARDWSAKEGAGG